MLYQNLLLSKLLLSLGYPYTLEYKEVLLTTVNTNYTAYQSLFVWFTKSFCFEKKKFSQQIEELSGKKFSLSQQKKSSQDKRKILTSKETFLQQKNNSQGKRKILKAK